MCMAKQSKRLSLKIQALATHACLQTDCEVAIGPTSNGLVLCHRRCLYHTWVLFGFWQKNRVPRSGLTMTFASREDLLVVGENEVMGSLWGVCLSWSMAAHVATDARKISCPVGHPPEFIAGIEQQQQP